MSKFPEPPVAADLAGIAPEWKTLAQGTALWRLYFRGGKHPTLWNTFRTFGPTSSRFDHHLPASQPPDRAILYAAAHGPTCLAEVFQDTRVLDRIAKDPWLVGFSLQLPVVLLDLAGPWPTRAGASMAINTGPRPRSQRWSRVIYEAYPEGQGLHYPSSMHGNLPAVALYERSLPALPPVPIFHRPLRDPALLPVLKRIARDLGYGLV